MGIFQPLYYSGGRYSSYADRKLLTALIDSNSSGVRVEGVIPAAIGTNAMLVEYSSPNTIVVNPGMAVIADSVASSASSGLFLAGIDGSDETVTFETATASRTDRVYAVVNTGSKTITNKNITSNTATLTTDGAHGFKVNQTVVVSGVDSIFDGTHIITAISATGATVNKFSYALTADPVDEAVTPELRYGSTRYEVNNKALSAAGLATLTITPAASFTAGQLITVKGVDATFDGTYAVATTTSSSTSVTYRINKPNAEVTSVAVNDLSAVAQARVPFFIGVEPSTGTSPGGVAAGTFSNNYPSILLAEISIPAGSAVGTVTDKRTFTTARGGVHIYTSATPSAPTETPGRFRYNTSTNTLEYYTTSWKTFVELADDTSSTKAARGNHTHSGYALTGHDHNSPTPTYALTSHQHVIADITDFSTANYVAPAAAVGKGYASSTVANAISNTSFTNLTPNNAASITLGNNAYILVSFSGEMVSSSSSAPGYMSVAVSGGTTISAEPTAGTSSHRMGATDGTAYSYGDMATVYGTNMGANSGMRVFKLAAGDYTFTLQAKATAGATVTVSNVSLNILPIRVYS